MSHSGKAPGREAKKETKERSPNLGGRRPGAGRPKGSKYGKRRHFMCYLNSEDAEKFEEFAETVGMSPYMVLKSFAKATITDGLRKINEVFSNYDESDQEIRLMFHVGVDFDTTFVPVDESELSEEDWENGIFMSIPSEPDDGRK
ncbi:MAG: hypothetical protein K6E40_17090 [Desulfovibrio sp.]|nr:hypothetical protein [Desulfovibrio sp.]